MKTEAIILVICLAALAIFSVFQKETIKEQRETIVALEEELIENAETHKYIIGRMWQHLEPCARGRYGIEYDTWLDEYKEMVECYTLSVRDQLTDDSQP